MPIIVNADVLYSVVSKFSLSGKVAEFSLVDPNGEALGAGILGLLIYNDGTVCDDLFGTHSADAICRSMGYIGHTSWTSGDEWLIQEDYEIKLDDVRCSSGAWNYCTFTSLHNCQHSEDVFLQCEGLSKYTSILRI